MSSLLGSSAYKAVPDRPGTFIFMVTPLIVVNEEKHENSDSVCGRVYRTLKRGDLRVEPPHRIP
jgi:hypothetical protein